MIRLSMVLWVAAIALAAVFLYEVKHRVQDLEEQLAEVHGDILRDQEAIQVLKAEWSYLNRPSRIAALADRYLELKPIEASQIASFREVPQTPETTPETTPQQQEPAPRTQEASLPQQAETGPSKKDSIGNLIEAVAIEEQSQPAAATQAPAPTPRQDQATPRKQQQGPVNPVTGEPLPVSAQGESAGQPIQLIRTGAQQ